ncbi:MAG: DUF1501 domain-containing protein [Planctomycetales bacterium]|nr:DUF1501 domain-containing protein [Planctomycetales bacterium]
MHPDTRALGYASRRMFLAHAARVCFGVGTAPWLAHTLRGAEPTAASGGTARSVIYLYMSGGMSHLDTFDTKPGAATQGPVESIPTNVPGMRIAHYFPQLATHMDKVALIRSMHSTQGAHVQGRYYMHTSYFLRGTIQHPELGAYASHLLGRHNPRLPAHVKIGGDSSGLGAGFLEAQHAAVPIGDPTKGLQHSQRPQHIRPDQFARRLAHVQRMNALFQQRHGNRQTRAYSRMYDEAVRLMSSKDLASFDLSQESEATREAYGDTRFGQGCLLARRLIESRVRFVEVDYGGWDTHSDNFGRLAPLAGTLDQALSALLADLDHRGLLSTTLVAVATEFGRTPDIVTTQANGRNHYPQAFSCLLAGGGIRGGRSYGKTDAEGRQIVESPVAVPDFNATIAHAMGLPLQKEIVSPSQRPFQVAADGKPVLELFRG